jgi:hypothetical protein
MRLVFEFSLPFIFIVAAYALRSYLDVSRPAPRALGCILPKLCVVNSDEIQRYFGMEEEGNPFPSLRREVRRKQVWVVWGYMNGMTWNTKLFQQALRFEKMKINPAKWALAYEPKEVLVLTLVDEAAEKRWLLVRAQIVLAVRTLSGQKIDLQALKLLLAQYKHLEQEMLAFTSMAQDDCYYAMLVERLGLNAWGVHEGGSSTPA